MKFKVTLKRIVYAEVEVEADTVAEVYKILATGDNDLDYFSMSDNIWGAETKVVSVKKKGEQ